MNNWVAIFNITPETRLLTIHALLEFGEIVEEHIMSDTLILVKFQEELGAQAALLRRALPISASHVVGIVQPQESWLQQVPNGAASTTALSYYPERRMPRVRGNRLQRFLDWFL